MDTKHQIRAIKGVRDILPPDSALWEWFEQTARQVLESYNFREIRLPVIEYSALFTRSVGLETDIVSKEMYTFPDPVLAADRGFLHGLRTLRDLNDAYLKNRGGIISKSREYVTAAFDALHDSVERATAHLVSLRPEATASVVRAYIEHGMHTRPGLTKLYYLGPMFRRERPQKGRHRQFYQIGAEVLGSSDHPAIDAEVIEMLIVLLQRCGLTRSTLLINSIGCSECRPKYIEALRQALEPVKARMCEDCQRRAETHPLRVLDCKVPADQPIIEKLPKITEHLDGPCRAHFEELQRQLALRAIPYTITPRLVRGLDYYTRTTFEITSPRLGAQNALVGGGRYDGLSELLGGPPAKGIGFALGEDRFIEVMKAAGTVIQGRPLDVFLAWIGEASYPVAVRLARQLRSENLSVEIPSEDTKLKKSLGLADKLGARYALIVGETEIAEGKYVLKRLADGEQKKLSEAELVAYLKSEHDPLNMARAGKAD